MLRINCSLSLVAFLAIALLILPSKGWAAELPEGVKVQVVAEYSVDAPGIEKVVLRKLSLQPGATWQLKVKDQAFCNATQGMISVFDHDAGTTTLYATGSRWAPAKGHTFTISNPGEGTHVHWIYALIEKM